MLQRHPTQMPFLSIMLKLLLFFPLRDTAQIFLGINTYINSDTLMTRMASKDNNCCIWQ